MEKGFVFFNDFIFRTPFYDYDRGGLMSRMRDKSFDEALFLASPDFFDRYKGNIDLGKCDSKIEQSLHKYLTRATTRCTPFGLFAGCSTGRFSNEDCHRITLVDHDSYKRVTRLDMNYLCALVQNLESRAEIRERLRYYPNDSVYYLGGKLRYIEYYYAGTRRIHRISSVDPDDYLKGVLELVSTGKCIDEIVDYLVDDDIQDSEAREYIEELISSQLLKSELELCVTGKDAFDRLRLQIQDIAAADEVACKLNAISDYLKMIDSAPFGKSREKYESIISIVKEIGVAYEPKFLFQTDMYKPTASGCLSENIKQELSSLINFLSKITPTPPRTNVSEFRKAYYERFEEREMPLLEVLDSELGIGFAQTGSADTPNDLVKGVYYNMTQPNSQPEKQSRFEMRLLKKYIETIQMGSDKIVLEDRDIGNGEARLDDLPPTMYLMCSIAGEYKYVKYIGGPCGANLLGRFCHLDSSVEKFSKEITEMDQRHYPDTILAEIVHLPESRIGNILFRPILRDYEIHYLAKPAVADEFSISLSDLMVSVRGDRVILRSKRLNKEIIPRLTTAHNYGYNALPVYQFLCEMQTQNMRGGLLFSWGSLLSDFDFKPRVQYKNFILSRAQWLIKEGTFPKSRDDIEKYLKEKNIPDCVIIAEGDNEQYIDFNDNRGVELFTTMLKKRKAIWVEEFLFKEGDSPVNDVAGGSYCNEFIFVCHKNI